MSIKLETPRLIIRSPKVKDIPFLQKLIQDSLQELSKWMPWAINYNKKDTENFISYSIEQWNSKSQKDFFMVIVNKESNELLGCTGFNDHSDTTVPFYEVGYWLGTKFTGNGFATETVNFLTDYAFNQLNAVRVQLCAYSGNIKSINVAKRCEFIYEATLKNTRIDLVTKQPADTIVFCKLKN